MSIIATLATTFASDKPKILGIGCGYGDATAKILELNPHISVCLVDFSEEMLQLVGERFGDDTVQIINHDLNDGVPDSLESSKFDAIVSCHALHHIEHENKAELYTQIRRVLVEDGLFIIGDRFIGESPVVSEWEFDNWISWETKQIKSELGRGKPFEEVKKTQIEGDERLGDKPGTLWDTQRDLKQAGFLYVDCVWKNHNMAIVVAANR